MLKTLLNLIIPVYCAGCSLPDQALCDRCSRSFGAPRPVDRPGKGPPMYTLATYDGPARRAVIAYKERGRRELATPLGRALANGLTRLHTQEPWLLVPAPSRPSAARQRGGQHMLRIAHRCAEALTVAGHHAEVHPLLKLAPSARDSVGLDLPARTANLAGRLTVDPIPGAQVVLVDDVITTGATARACASALAAKAMTITAVVAMTATS